MGYRDLLDLDYAAYDHVKDFAEQLEERRIRDADVSLGYHYDEGTPVLDVHGEGRRKEYIDSYRLEGVSPEDFEELAYDLWADTFEEEFSVVQTLEEL